MAQFSQQEQDQMRREAARRAREMQQQVYTPVRRTSSRGDYPPTEEPEPEFREPPPPKPPPQHPGKGGLAGLSQWNPGTLLSRLDSDTVLILALMVMLYQNGGWENCDKKLMLALTYLLT